MRSYVDKKVTLKAGKSAYDIWATSSKAVEYANKHNKELKDLTELDFIDSLKGEQGIKGDGESAYQSWLKQDGNAGKSEGDFVKWLKGEKGQDGKNGKDGKSAFEVWKEKKNYGKVSMGVVRTTYLIDEQGIIIKANDKVKAADDPENMLKELA